MSDASATTCLRCLSSRVVVGGIYTHAHFFPHDPEFAILHPVVRARGQAHLCLTCGLLWSTVDAVKANEQIRRWGVTSSPPKQRR